MPVKQIKQNTHQPNNVMVQLTLIKLLPTMFWLFATEPVLLELWDCNNLKEKCGSNPLSQCPLLMQQLNPIVDAADEP